MKQKLSYEEARRTFQRFGASIDEDKERGLFGNKDVSWQNAEPQTAEEIALNLFDRMRSLIGVNIGMNTEEIDPISLMRFADRRGSLDDF